MHENNGTATQTGENPTDNRPPAARWDWSRTAALAVLTALAVYVCYLLAAPFLPALAWAVALAAIGLPLHRRVRRLISSENWAAGVSTGVVVLAIAVPATWVAGQLAVETKGAAERVQAHTGNGQWRDAMTRIPYVRDWVAELDVAEVETHVRSALLQWTGRSLSMMETVAGGVVQALAAVFILFFCFRDRHHLLNSVRGLIPLAPVDADRVITRADDAIHATVYGTLLAGVIQGVTGGLLFWALGLPAPVLWGTVMALLGVLPFVGAFLVWVPAAYFLVLNDRFAAAFVLVAWGLLMAGPVCNAVYAIAAGDRMKMHPVPALLAFIGGLAVFGISGMVLGPCVLAVTVALLDVWRYRVPDGITVLVPGVADENRAGQERDAVGTAAGGQAQADHFHTTGTPRDKQIGHELTGPVIQLS